MKFADRFNAIDRIGRELQARYTFADIDNYLQAFGVATPNEFGSSKWSYVKQTLASADLSTIDRIIDDLGLGSLAQVAAQANPSAHWLGSKDFRLFISHLSRDKAKAIRLKEGLSAHAISGFVAHEDIEPSRVWQDEIERALFTMDALVAVCTTGFSASVWANQEIGFALGRGVKVISVKMGEDPVGFISKRQAVSRGQRSAEEIAAEIDGILAADPTTADRLATAKEARVPINTSLDDEIPF